MGVVGVVGVMQCLIGSCIAARSAALMLLFMHCSAYFSINFKVFLVCFEGRRVEVGGAAIDAKI